MPQHSLPPVNSNNNGTPGPGGPGPGVSTCSPRSSNCQSFRLLSTPVRPAPVLSRAMDASHEEPPSPWKRMPRPALPSLPSNTGLRSALLGYLGAVETSLRDRLSSTSNGILYEEDTPISSSSASEEDQALGAGTSTGVELGDHTGIRNRHHRDSARVESPTEDLPPEVQQSLLRHIFTLREDVLAYLPSRLAIPSTPAVAGASTEWLRTLPNRLSLLDISLSRPASPNPFGKGKGREAQEDLGHVQNARRRVIELVHALLPSEEWAGWERLGWEDTDLSSGPAAHRQRLQRRATEGTRHETWDFDEEGEHEEPEYLFPNRTASSVQALANRRRTMRSKSLGMANKPGSLAWLLQDMPPLVRTKTDPTRHMPLPDEEEETAGEERGEMGVEGVLDGALDPTSAKLEDKLPSHLGPTVAEALDRADGGKKMIMYEDLPFIWRNNEHILEG